MLQILCSPLLCISRNKHGRMREPANNLARNDIYICTPQTQAPPIYMNMQERLEMSPILRRESDTTASPTIQHEVSQIPTVYPRYTCKLLLLPYEKAYPLSTKKIISGYYYFKAGEHFVGKEVNKDIRRKAL